MEKITIKASPIKTIHMKINYWVEMTELTDLKRYEIVKYVKNILK